MPGRKHPSGASVNIHPDHVGTGTHELEAVDIGGNIGFHPQILATTDTLCPGKQFVKRAHIARLPPAYGVALFRNFLHKSLMTSFASLRRQLKSGGRLFPGRPGRGCHTGGHQAHGANRQTQSPQKHGFADHYRYLQSRYHMALNTL